MIKRPLILVTNDDGICSPGLAAVVEAVSGFGELLIVAPHTQQTGMGRAFPRGEQTGIIEKKKIRIRKQEYTSYAVSVSAGLEKQRCNYFEDVKWEAAQIILQAYVKKVLEKKGPKEVDIWNINVPNGIGFPYPYRITSQSRQNYFDFIRPKKRDLKKPYELKSELYVREENHLKQQDFIVEKKIQI